MPIEFVVADEANREVSASAPNRSGKFDAPVAAWPRSVSSERVLRERQPHIEDGDPRHSIRLADDVDVRTQASELLRRRYQSRGYDLQAVASGSGGELELVSIDRNSGRVTGTLTMVLDGPDGLAAGQVYRAEVRGLRESGLKLCEGVRFAADGAANSLTVLPALFHVAFIWAHRVHGCTDLLIEVTPRHALFYRRMLGFEILGKECLNPRVNTTGVLLHLDMQLASERIGQLRQRVPARLGLYEYALPSSCEREVIERLRDGDPILAYLL